MGSWAFHRLRLMPVQRYHDRSRVSHWGLLAALAKLTGNTLCSAPLLLLLSPALLAVRTVHDNPCFL